MPKPTLKTLKKLAKDERKASKEYRAYGLHGLAKDESKHRRVLMKEIKKRKKRR
jgi:hypothetical protein